jgi:hypothetical protein
MKTITIKGKDYAIRNEGHEVTLNELAKISLILENEAEDFVDKWLRVFEILGSRELVDAIPLNKFVEVQQSVDITQISNEIKPIIEVNGRTYSCQLDEEGNIELSAKDMAKIERMYRKGGTWGVKAFAVVYKDDALTKFEHHVDSHIDHKAKLFGDAVTADVAAPVVFQLAKEVMKYIQSLIDAQSKSIPAN